MIRFRFRSRADVVRARAVAEGLRAAATAARLLTLKEIFIKNAVANGATPEQAVCNALARLALELNECADLYEKTHAA